LESAVYVGCSPGLFDDMVADDRMPQPRQLSERRFVWDRFELDRAFEALPYKNENSLGDDEGDDWKDVEERDSGADS